MAAAIKVENLGKKYIIQHEKTESYETLRDSLMYGSKKLLSRIAKPTQTIKANQEEFWALQDINFEINQGDKVGIIGRNGAGKSTLLKVLSRITEPTTGKIHINGRIASLLEVGTGFHPELTGRENIYLNGAILGMSRREIKAKFDEIVAFSEVEKFLDTPVKRYSSGMYVRLAFAVAAHLEPEILIVDEVLAVGDIEFQKKCLGKMGEVSKEGRTVIFVSHQMSAVSNLCNNGIVVDNGMLTFKGSSSEAIDFYLSTNTKLSNGFSEFLNNNGNNSLIKSVGLLDTEENKYRNWISTGETFILEVEFSTNTEKVDYCFLAFCNARGDRIFSTGTNFDSNFNKNIHGNGKLICLIENFPLVDGEYSLDVALGKKGKGNLEHLPAAITFRVQLDNFFNTGQALLPGQGNFAIKSRWDLE